MPNKLSIPEKVKNLCLAALEDLKALNIKEMYVEKISSFTSNIIVATGTSTRHIQSIADKVVDDLKDNKIKILGLEGDEAKDWILIDAGDVLVNIMTEESREHYDLESLWDRAKSAS